MYPEEIKEAILRWQGKKEVYTLYIIARFWASEISWNGSILEATILGKAVER